MLLERYLHQQIPLSAAMGVRVRMATPERVQLAVPLAPNINHNETAFGGSAAALATLSAWALLHLRLAGAGLQARLVIQRSSMEYEQPIPGRLRCRLPLHGRAGVGAVPGHPGAPRPRALDARGLSGLRRPANGHL